MDYVGCTDCGKQLPAVQMRTFQKYEFIDASPGLMISIMERRYWEEVIPGKKRRDTRSDKLPEVKVLCPSCANRLKVDSANNARKPLSGTDKVMIWVPMIIMGIICLCLLIVYYTVMN